MIDKEKEVFIQHYKNLTDTSGFEIKQSEVLEVIKSDKYKDICEKLRTDFINDKKARQAYKAKMLPLVTFGGLFNTRNMLNLKQHSKQLSIDFDVYDRKESDKLFSELKKSEYIYIMFRSPSYGIKVVLKIPEVKDDAGYKDYFFGAMLHFESLCPTNDATSQDITRLCYYSYDKDLYVNNNAVVFNKKATKEEAIKETPKKKIIKDSVKSFDKESKENMVVPEMCPFIEKVASVSELPSGQKTRHGYLDGNVFQYCRTNKKNDVLKKYMEVQGRDYGAFNGSENFIFSCGTIRSYMKGNIDNGFVMEGKKICDNCPEYKKFKEENKRLIIPGLGKMISKFAVEVGDLLQPKGLIFVKPQEQSIVEIRKIKTEDDNKEVIGFHNVTCNRLISLVEAFATSGVYEEKKDTIEFKEKSAGAMVMSVVIESDQFMDKLDLIKRIFPVPIPIIYKGALTFPKLGYDHRFSSWTPLDAPEITEIPLTKAKSVLQEIYDDFPFVNDQDKTNAIAALLTPFLRGLYSKFNVRVPVYFYQANRERAGKDYCAGITGILYEGSATEEPPISNNTRVGNNDEELRKKITASFINGRKRLHFANNKGKIDNSVFEQIVTATHYSDRVLGKTEIVRFENEMEFTLSGNIGVSYTADFANRSIFINLAYLEENANERTFTNPNLHGWVLDNRGLILSAMYAIIKHWYDNGMTDGKTPFTSFPEWARICGGIMEMSELGNPCITKESEYNLGGDEELENMRNLYEYMYNNHPNEWITKQDLKKHIENATEEDIFGYFDFSNKSDATKFGNILEKYKNRIISNIVMVNDNNIRTKRRKVKFGQYVKKWGNENGM